jgi:hypothetical protein
MENTMILRALLLICTWLLILDFSSVFASWERKPKFRWTQLYRYDLRQDNHQLYTNRISSTFYYMGNEDKALFEATAFFEARRNVNKDLWERKELGLELGRSIFNWLYLGQAFQKGWMNEDFRTYGSYEKMNYFESETRLLLGHTLLSIGNFDLKGYALNEYTYDFDEEKSKFNELVIGLILPISGFMVLNINWRHIDRIHYYDSDTFEGSFSIEF